MEKYFNNYGKLNNQFEEKIKILSNYNQKYFLLKMGEQNRN